MKTAFMKIALGLLLCSTVFTACKKDPVEEPNEEEVITTMKLTFVPVGGGPELTYQFDDADGPGGAAPTQDEIVLNPLKVYNCTIQLLNKTETPVADITTEVKAEGEAHRFYYEPSAGSNLLVSNLDNDANGVALGITSTWGAGVAATGTVKVTLRHYAGMPPSKAAGDLVNSSKSSTDIEVVFNTKIQ